MGSRGKGPPAPDMGEGGDRLSDKIYGWLVDNGIKM